MAEIPSLPSLDRSVQKTDIPIKCGTLGIRESSKLELLLRYMYYRSSESRSSIDPDLAIGQDYLEWSHDPLTNSFDFVVCDGVGQSYLGYIASEFLGRKWIDLLKNSGTRLVKAWTEKKSEKIIWEMIVKEFLSWQPEANQRVNESQLPLSLPPMVQLALEESRTSHGSETVFVCGHIGVEDKVPYLLLFWMGDVRFRLFKRDGKEVLTEVEWKNSERWSTKYGLKGRSMPNCWIVSLLDDDISRIMAYSDGLSSIEKVLPTLSSSELQQHANQLLVSPSSDDISFLDLLVAPFDGKTMNSFKDLPSPKTVNHSLQLINKQISLSECLLSWAQVREVEHYVVLEKITGFPWREIFRSTTPSVLKIKDRPSGSYKYKLIVIYAQAKEEESPEILIELIDNQQNKENSKIPASTQSNSSIPQPVEISITASPVLTSVSTSRTEYSDLELPKIKIEKDFEEGKVYIKWGIIKNVDGYSVSITKKGDLRPRIFNDIINTKDVLVWEPEKWEGDYEIRVRAHKGTMLPIESIPQFISLEFPKPSMPLIEGLKRMQIMEGETLQLSCISSGEAYSGLVDYEWQYSTPQEKTQYVVRRQHPYIDCKHDDPGEYYYKVRVTRNNLWSDWSEPVIINVEPSLGRPNIIYPPDKSKLGHNFILQWTDTIGAQKYSIQYQEEGYSSDKWEEYKGAYHQKKDGTWECEVKDNENGKFIVRVKAYGKKGKEVTSKAHSVEIYKSDKLTSKPKLPREIKITSIEWRQYGGCEVIWNESHSRYIVLRFTSRDVKSYATHKSVPNADRCYFDIVTPGIYYFYVIEDLKKDGSYELPESSQGFVEFKTPLKTPILTSSMLFEVGSNLNKGTLKLEWIKVNGADSYRLVINGKESIIPSVSIQNNVFTLIDFINEGLHTIALQAVNKMIGLESDIKLLRIYVKKKNNRLEITRHEEVVVKVGYS